MLLNFLLCFALIGVVLSGGFREMKEVYENYQEWPCLASGGMCVKTSDCPADKRSAVKGLCPLRQEEGYECCHAVPQSETRCRENGGECMPRSWRCPEHLTFGRATDCQTSEKCCILVRSSSLK